MSGRWPLAEAVVLLLVWAGLMLMLLGCSGQKPAPAAASKTAARTTRAANSDARPASADKTPPATRDRTAQPPAPAARSNRKRRPPPDRTLADLIEQATGEPEGGTPYQLDASPSTAATAADLGENEKFALVPPGDLLKSRTIDESELAAMGIRKLAGKHLTLYTDLAADAEVDALPRIFDLAFPQWCAYFHVDPRQYDQWRMNGFIIQRKERFQVTDLLPPDLPPFLHGYARGGDLWLYEQPTPYYRRHLLLHEGTHGFMQAILGSAGPPWYMEGTAELLGTHLWRDGKLTLGYFPRDRDDVPMLGRIKIVEDAYADKHAMTLGAILQYSPRAHLENEPYAWCWAAAAFLDGHPRYRDRFRSLYRHVRALNFNQRFLHLYRDDWTELSEEWQVFVANLEHGYDLERTAIDFTPGRPLARGMQHVAVVADRGWQNTGLRLQAGVRYTVTAAGRYQVANVPEVWWCEPGGVTIEYYQGWPLGMLLAAVRPDEPASGVTALIRPVAVGTEVTLRPDRSGTLYLEINESPCHLDDNAGELQVEIAAP